MADKVAELEERLNRLEEKLKVTFIEVEKRLNQQQQQPVASFEDRMQELEDLILLLQLENTKLKEKIGEGLDFGIAPNTPDLSERLTRVESEVVNAAVPNQTEIEAKIVALEERINSLQTVPTVESEPVSVEIEPEHPKKKKKIETIKTVRAHEEESDLLSAIQRILGHG